MIWASLILFCGSPYGIFVGEKVRHFTYMSQVLKGVFHIGEFAILTALILLPLHRKKISLGKTITRTIVISFGVAFISEFSQFQFSSWKLFEWMDLSMNGVGIGIVLLFYAVKTI